MQVGINHRFVVRIGILTMLIGASFLQFCFAGEPASGDAKAPGDGSKGIEEAAKPSAPKKTEYDKLPLAELVQRAKADDLTAQFELGSRLNYGRAMPKNVKEALRWLRRAAQNGQKDAQRLLALKFYQGFEVPPNHEESFKWTQRLAEEGDVPAQLTLANMYASGEGTERNLVRAYMWYDIAAAAAGKEGVPDAVAKAAQAAAEQREKVVSLLLPDQEVVAQQLSSDWWLQQTGVSLEEKKATGDSKPRR